MKQITGTKEEKKSRTHSFTISIRFMCRIRIVLHALAFVIQEKKRCAITNECHELSFNSYNQQTLTTCLTINKMIAFNSFSLLFSFEVSNFNASIAKQCPARDSLNMILCWTVQLGRTILFCHEKSPTIRFHTAVATLN